MNDWEYRLLKNNRSFKTGTHKVANSLHISDADASQIVYTYVSHRLESKKDWNVAEKLDSNSPDFNWLITWSAKDAKTDFWKREYKEQEKRESLKAISPDSYLINLEKPYQSMNDVEKERIIKLLPKIFKYGKTQEFAELVLRYGEERTKEILGITSLQFKKKMVYLEKYCRDNKEELINMILSKEEAKLQREEYTLKIAVDALESEKFNDDIFQIIMDRNRPYYDDLIGSIPMIKRPVQLLNNFAGAINEDKYKLINEINKRYEYLKHQLNEAE